MYPNIKVNLLFTLSITQLPAAIAATMGCKSSKTGLCTTVKWRFIRQ